MTWSTGAAKIRELLENGELDVVESSVTIARQLLADAERHLASARTIGRAGDLSGAYQLAYDALRKAAASLLAAQGLRATSRGGHIAVQDAVIAQFGDGVAEFRSDGVEVAGLAGEAQLVERYFVDGGVEVRSEPLSSALG